MPARLKEREHEARKLVAERHRGEADAGGSTRKLGRRWSVPSSLSVMLSEKRGDLFEERLHLRAPSLSSSDAVSVTGRVMLAE